MATIRASCPDCGDIELTSDDVTVYVLVGESAGSYSYPCPACRKIVSKGAEPRIVELLVTSGVRFISGNFPAELEESHEGPPITDDDLIDFHGLMETDDWLDKLMGQ